MSTLTYNINDDFINGVNINKLKDEIQYNPNITTEIDYINEDETVSQPFQTPTEPETITIYFKTTLQAGETDVINTIVENHHSETFNQINNQTGINTDILKSAIKNNYILEGGIFWKDNYNFIITNTKYVINNNIYSVPNTIITLDASDNSDRYDTICLGITNGGHTDVMKGMPNESPSPMDVNQLKCIKLCDVLVKAGTTEPDYITNNYFYDNGTTYADWSLTTNGENITVGITCISFNDVMSEEYLDFTHTSQVTLIDYDILVFVVKCNKIFPENALIELTLFDSVSNSKMLVSNTKFGFDRYNVTDYQYFVVDLSIFKLSTIYCNKFRIKILTEKPHVKVNFDLYCARFQNGMNTELLTTDNKMISLKLLGLSDGVPPIRDKKGNNVNIRAFKSINNKLNIFGCDQFVNYKIQEENILFGSTGKGDIVVSTGTTMTHLDAGTTGQILIADPSLTHGVKWEDQKVFQNVGSGSQIIKNDNYDFRSIIGGENLTTSQNSNDITIDLDDNISLQGNLGVSGTISGGNIAKIKQISLSKLASGCDLRFKHATDSNNMRLLQIYASGVKKDLPITLESSSQTFVENNTGTTLNNVICNMMYVDNINIETTQSGLKATCYDITTGTTFGDMLCQDVVESIDYDPFSGSVLTSNRITDIGVKFEGYITSGTTGDYRFKLVSSDGIKLYIDGSLQNLRKDAEDGDYADGWVDQSSTTYYTDLISFSGTKSIRIDWYENTLLSNAPKLSVSWKEDGGSYSIATEFTHSI